MVKAISVKEFSTIIRTMVTEMTCRLMNSVWKSIGLVALTCQIVWAQSPPTPIYLQPVPYYMDSTEKGTYVDLVKRFGEEIGHRFEFFMASSERIEKLLVRGEKNFCSVGFSLELAVTEGLPTAHLQESQSFNRIYTSIISSRESPVESVQELNNSTLVVFHGNYQDAVQRIPDGFDTSVVVAYNIDSIINLVQKRRVDAGFVTSPDILMSPLYQKLQPQLYLVELPDSDRRESLVCIDSIENRKLITSFDLFIEKLRKQGELAQYIDYQPMVRPTIEP